MVIQSEKMMSIGGLAAGMAHEINNPLAGMIQNVQVIRNRLTKELPANMDTARRFGLSMPAVKAYMEERGILNLFDNIHMAGRHAAGIVDNMLSFARKSGGIREEQPLDVLIDKALALAKNDYSLKKNYDFKKIAIVREYAEDVPPVLCEEGKIQQVLFNLIKNASEAMRQDRSTIKDPPRLTLRLGKQPGMAVIDVEDNGPGMPPETRRRVFEPFFTTKNVNEGTGLGLSVSYFIVVDDHNGVMDVESTPGIGTRFVIKLPLSGKNSSMSP